MKFSIIDFFNKCDQIHRKLRIWSYLLKKSLMENLIFCAVVQVFSWCLFSQIAPSQMFDWVLNTSLYPRFYFRDKKWHSKELVHLMLTTQICHFETKNAVEQKMLPLLFHSLQSKFTCVNTVFLKMLVSKSVFFQYVGQCNICRCT